MFDDLDVLVILPAFMCLGLDMFWHLWTLDSDSAIASEAEEFEDEVATLGVLEKETIKCIAL